jgi:hypothetical protein
VIVVVVCGRGVGTEGAADRGWATMLTLVHGPVVVVRSHDDDGELSPRL